jgi:hypothetical protein
MANTPALDHPRVACHLAACIVFATAATGCTPPPSPSLLARCTQLYQLWWNYEQDPTTFHTGERARAELALYRCQNGKYEEGIQELQKLLQRQ